mmetsp:Transcript_53522/g.116679  ORF Transcript_53522/g.116679 Transcript_53522/m.116679 type:complete len:233 (-) Transcript_53522:117-815(-)
MQALDLQDIYQIARNSHVPVVAREEESVRRHFERRQVIEKEANVCLREQVRAGAMSPQPAPTGRKTLLDFCESNRKDRAWGKALGDEDAALAMRALRRRVDELNKPGTSPSKWVHNTMNPRSPRKGDQTSHAAHPLSVKAIISPRYYTPAVNRDAKYTSLWTPAFGAVASEAGVDFNMSCTHDRNPGGVTLPRLRNKVRVAKADDILSRMKQMDSKLSLPSNTAIVGQECFD